MAIPKINSAHGSDTRNILNRAIDLINAQGKSIQDLVAEGQLTPQQFAELLNLIHNNIKKGEGGSITEEMLSQGVKELLTGGSVAVVGKDSILNENIVDGQITNNKLDLMGVEIPKLFSAFRNSAATRFETESEVMINSGEKIIIEEGSIYEFSLQGNFNKGWTSETYTFNRNFTGIIQFRKNDNSTFPESELPTMQKQMYIITDKTITNYDTALNIISEQISKMVLEGFPVNAKIVDEHPVDGSTSGTYKYTPFKTLEAGYRAQLPSDSIFSFTLVDENSASRIPWSKSYTSGENVKRAFRIRKDNVTAFSTEDVNNLIDEFKLFPVLDINTPVSKRTLYVAPNGSDENDGLSPTTPLATFQYAIDSGAENILAERGRYLNQQLHKNGGNISIKPHNSEVFSGSKLDVQKIEIINGTQYTAALNGQRYEFQFSGNTQYSDVFINKTLAPESGGSRPSFNAGLWQNHSNWEEDELLKPVLTTAELSEEGTFFWDGSTVQINAHAGTSNVVGFTVQNESSLPFRIENCNEVKLEDVEALYSRAENIRIMNCMDVTCRNITSKYTLSGNGVKMDDTNGNFYNCESHKARNDGFNMHNYGDTNFYNCKGNFNGDDGISHHYGCTGTITQGEYNNNGKSGVAPTYGSDVDLYHVYAKSNPTNFLISARAEDPVRSVKHFGNVSVDAGLRDIFIKNYIVEGYLNLYGNVELSEEGVYNNLS